MLAIENYLIISLIVTPVIESLHLNERNCTVYCNNLMLGYTLDQNCNCSNKDQTKTSIKNISPLKLEGEAILYEPLEYNTNLRLLKNIHLQNPISKSIRFPRRTNHKINNYTLTKIGGQNKELLLKRQSNLESNIKYNNIIPIYLDIDVPEKLNATFGKELRNVSDNLQPIERDLQDCIGLNNDIMVSNNIDNINKTNTNWGYNVKRFDNVSDLKILSQAKNKCKPLIELMELGLGHILKKYHKNTEHTTVSRQIEKSKGSNPLDRVIDSYTVNGPYTETTYPISYIITENNNLFQTMDRMKDNQITYQSSSNAVTTEPTGFRKSVFNHDSKEIDITLSTLDWNEDTKTYSDHQLNYLTTSQQNIHSNLSNKMDIRTSVETDATITINKNTNEFYQPYDITTTPGHIFTDINTVTDKEISRPLYPEEDIRITKIITKEFANNTVTSNIDGYESLPNSDFDGYETTYNKLEPNDSTDTGEYIQVAKNNTIVNQTNIWTPPIPEIKGRLYFLYGNHEIPVNFIQKRDGEINMAIDTHLMCDKYFDQGNKESIFMRIMCNCVLNNKCTDGL